MQNGGTEIPQSSEESLIRVRRGANGSAVTQINSAWIRRADRDNAVRAGDAVGGVVNFNDVANAHTERAAVGDVTRAVDSGHCIGGRICPLLRSAVADAFGNKLRRVGCCISHDSSPKMKTPR